MNKKIKKRITAAAIVMLLIAANLFAVQLTRVCKLRLDLTDEKLYELSDETIAVLADTNREIMIKVFSTRTDYSAIIAEILDRYEMNGGGKVKISYVDPYENPSLVEKYIGRGYDIRLGTILVEGPVHTVLIQEDEMYVMSSDNSSVRAIKCEGVLTGAIIRARENREGIVAFTAGHDESVSDAVINIFSQNGYETKTVNFQYESTDITPDLLVIASPGKDFSESEIKYLDSYMEKRGRILVSSGTASVMTPNLKRFLEEWGVGLTDILVAEEAQYTDSNPLSIVPIYANHEITTYFLNNQIPMIMPSTYALEQLYLMQNGTQTQKVLYSSDRAYDQKGSDEIRPPYALAMSVVRETNDGESKMVITGSKGVFTTSLLENESCGNALFLTESIMWLTEEDDLIGIPPKKISGMPITVTQKSLIVTSIICIGVIPVLIFVAGIIIYLKRRNS